MRNCLLLLAICFSMPWMACDSNRLYEENKVIENQLWESKNRIPFMVEITDTNIRYNMYINVRNASDYPFSNLYLFMETRYPGGTYSKDTLECILADDKGQWLGNGSGDIWDNQIIFKRNIRFHKQGVYTFTLEQAMRLQKLPQILDVGIRIEKATGK
ncbi:MAG: gliding motility lipoprotein GldH [Bacteroidota bacterium]|jgi:gliding motility-associated lipoprotein GldH